MKTTCRYTRNILVPLAIIVFVLQGVAECGAQTPYTPGSATITSQTNGGTLSVAVSVVMPDSCHYVGSWGQPVIVGNNVYVDAQFWVSTGGGCLLYIRSVSTNYNIGTLPPGDYNFVFRAWGTTVETQAFSMPVLMSIVDPQDESQMQLCWNTATGTLYRLEYCSNLVTNGWEPLTAWIPGTGSRFCTNDAVLPEQPQKFYRVASTNAPQP